MMRAVTTSTCNALLLVVCVAATGCLGPAGSDQAGYSANLLDEHAKLPKLADDKLLAQKVDANDGLDGTLVPLRTGYAHGSEARYWDLGTTTTSAKPGWIFRRRNKDGSLEDFGHPNLIDSVPSDTTYTAVRAIYLVLVTSAYAGERITSPQALEDAVEIGLVEEPASTDTYADWPVVPATQQLDMGAGQKPMAASPIYYKGMIATYFPLAMTSEGFGAFKVPMAPAQIQAASAYVLKRQNEAKVLDEVVWKADLNGDGDQLDTNTIFAVTEMTQPMATPFWHEVDVIVASNYVWGTFETDTDLFQKQMMSTVVNDAAVIQYTENSMTWLNRVLQSEAAP